MAAARLSSGPFACSIKEIKYPKRRSRCRDNVLSKVFSRQMHGCFKDKLFKKIPGRLGFSLRKLVEETVLQDGHVFIGFTKCGRFMLSYNLQVEADDHTAFPVYVYRLHWWYFSPYQPMRRVAEVRLFGEEEIQQDLYIAFCEWPTDTSQVLVYGYCAPEDGEEKRLCFITITAVPSLEHCPECAKLQHLQDLGAYPNKAPPRCLKHGFTIHTKYELAPPYPAFAPKAYLKLDGIVILNTGDSLIALSVEVDECGSAGLFSIDMSKSDMGIVHNFDSMHYLQSWMGSITLPHNSAELPESPYLDRNNYAEKENFQVPSVPPLSYGDKTITENSKLNSSSTKTTTSGVEGKSILKDRLHNAEVPSSSVIEVSHTGNRTVMNNVLSPCRRPENMNHENTSSITGLTIVTPTSPRGQQLDSFPLEPLWMRDERPGIFCYMPSTSQDHMSLGAAVAFSPGSNRPDMSCSSSCSSCVSSPIIVQNDIQCFTYSLRHYADSQPSHHIALELEEDPCLAYHSVLPLEVRGAAYSLLHLQPVTCNPQTQGLTVKQLTMDIEHYLGETIRTTAVWGSRYLSITDYDVQILDVCPDTFDVIILVLALVRARSSKHEISKSKFFSRTPRVYQTSFKFMWNLQSGQHSTLDVDDLVEFEQSKSGRKDWCPGKKLSLLLQRQFQVPQAYWRAVHVLTNEAVLRGQSLKLLLDPHHYVAVLM